MYSEQLIDDIKAKNKKILDGLDYKTARKFYNLYKDSLSNGILLLFFSGYRDLNQQNILYQKYLQGTGNLAARPGYSWHNYGRAVDLVPVKENGYADKESPLYYTVNALAEKYGLKWLGAKDSPHFTDSQGETIQQVRLKGRAVQTRKKRRNISIAVISFLALLAIPRIAKL